MAYYDYAAVDVRAQAGQMSLSMMDLAKRVEQWKAWLDSTTDAELFAKVMTETEVGNIKSAATHMAELITAFRGTAALGQGDRQTFVKRLLGPVTY